jgi:hypothetical protein
MKQTAVEWLINKLDGENHLSTNEINRVIEQAIKMEKEQIKDAFNYGQFDLGMEADEYYNETFKSE